MNAWLTNNARLVMHLNSVSDGSIMVVKVDGNTLFSTNLPNLDGTYNVNEEYNLDIPVNLPAGLHSITITNTGDDWFYLDWVRVRAGSACNLRWQLGALGRPPSGCKASTNPCSMWSRPVLSFPANATQRRRCLFNRATPSP